jgi:hypothetical protein
MYRKMTVIIREHRAELLLIVSGQISARVIKQIDPFICTKYLILNLLESYSHVFEAECLIDAFFSFFQDIFHLEATFFIRVAVATRHGFF